MDTTYKGTRFTLVWTVDPLKGFQMVSPYSNLQDASFLSCHSRTFEQDH